MFSDFTRAKAISLKESSARSCVGVLHKVLCKLDHIRRFTKNNGVGLKHHISCTKGVKQTYQEKKCKLI